MIGLELVVVLCAAILLCGVLAPQLRISRPVLLLACGILVGLIPSLSGIRLEPDVVLLLFLPVLLYWESLTASLRSIRRGLRGVVLVSTLLVIATAAAAAATAHAFGLPWGPAWVLGAAVAPTDATAVAALGRLLPQRSLDMLKAESLVNDGTALVVYGVAVGVTTGGERLGGGHVGWLFLFAYVGGAAAGALVAWPALYVLRRLTDPVLSIVLALLTPFTAYLLAESVEASGVLAVVVCGLIVARVAPRVSDAASRTVGYPFFSMATYLLNATLFLLVGLEIPSAVRDLSSTALTTAVVIALAVFAVLVAVRIAFLFLSAYAIRALDRRPEQRLRRMSHRYRIVGGLSGFRGAVSLAVVLSVPTTLDDGTPFPDRDTLVFVTACVIVLTLVVQGALLPAVVRWADLPAETSAEEELRLAGTTATKDALAALDTLAADLGTGPQATDQLRQELQLHLDLLAAEPTGNHPALRQATDITTLRLAVIAHKRATVIRLRDTQRIDDSVLQRFQARLDAEEQRLAPTEPAE
ncbi:CPA1 family monovalent cation:H+ antiporter [Kitasatospora gansuensis]|uniref:CPA1 family monovalent cation:H+ antiporter n=1 Tax=Kitasatospora gansuensis TaxID=258050 RepID=A0A7W7WLJ8_9ACTN|nr:Na+/H+ antiporter [Kitasatospora gansuensis]MBB4950849.1 CPA1 family monovalent cation:H+ antiporter [Kitasatospora gansuensis]